METRTDRTPGRSGGGSGEPPTGGQRGFFDDEPGLSSVKVHSDPAQVVVSHASFRVQLAAPPAPGSPARAPVIGGSRGGARSPAGAAERTESGAATAGKRRAPVVWSGRTAPDSAGDGGTAELLRAVRPADPDDTGEAGAATRVLPRVGETPASGAGRVVGPRDPGAAETTRPQPLVGQGAPDQGLFGRAGHPDGDSGTGTPTGTAAADTARRQAYYPMRRMNLGVVLLPLRLFLGFITIYAGMGKLCDPVYFDGGQRGSMVAWLQKLEPWTLAGPLRDFALEHPVGAGLTVAFLQVIVGVLTICGLWQRLAAGIGALLSAALLVTVSWSTVPAYDAPDFIYLAAWSPLLIAGAPVYSVDAHLASDAWRKLGPRVALWDLRERVLKRGAVIATLVIGLALLIGSMLGGAVRSSQASTVQEPGKPPTNRLPGSQLPGNSGAHPERSAPGQGAPQPGTQGRTSSRQPSGPSASASPGDTGRQRQDSGRQSATPDQGQGQGQRETVQAPQQPSAPQQSAPPQQQDAPQSPEGGDSRDSGPASGSGSPSSSGDSQGAGNDSGDSGGGNSGGLGGLLGN